MTGLDARVEGGGKSGYAGMRVRSCGLRGCLGQGSVVLYDSCG